MSMVKTIKKEVKEGEFASVSEFIRHLIRLYNADKLAMELRRDSELYRQGKLKVYDEKVLDNLEKLDDLNE